MMRTALAQQAEVASADAGAHIVPIPAYGTKRLEMEYHEKLSVEELKSLFAVPLKPDVYEAQSAGRLTIRFELRSKLPLADFQAASKADRDALAAFLDTL